MEKMLVIVASLLLLVAIGTSAPISCPSKEDLDPCTCNRMAYGLHVVCADFEEASALVKAFRVLRDYKVQNVLLHGLKLAEVLPNDIFDGLDISQMKVQQSKLRFSEPAFTGLDESLHILNVAQNSMIKSSENFSLARLNKLTELTIKANPLGVVRDRWLNGKIPNVRSVRLDDDEINTIESRAFADLLNLESISIAENRIKTVERSMFPRPASKLKSLDLSGNEIRSLPYDFFFEMPVLTEVIFSGNDLTTLPEMTWKTVWEQLECVLLYENNLICEDKLNWLKKLRWPKQVVGICVGPSSMVGETLKDVYNT